MDFAVENFLPLSLRDGMLPIQRQNVQLLVSLIQQRISCRRLQIRNDQLKGNLKGCDETGEFASSGLSGVGDVHVDEGDLEDLALNVAELVALLVSYQKLQQKEVQQQQQIESLEMQHENCQMKLEELAKRQMKSLTDLDVNDIRTRFGHTKREVSEIRKLEESLEKDCQDGLEECLAETMASLEEEEIKLGESCMLLGAEEERMESEMEVEREESEDVHRLRLEVGKLNTLRTRLEAAQNTTQRHYHQEYTFWKSETERYTLMRQELTENAWQMSHALQEKVLEVEAAENELKTLSPWRDTNSSELQVFEAESRTHLARSEKALAPKQREVAEALNTSFSLRKEAAVAYQQCSGAKISEAEAARELRQTLRRQAALKGSLQRESSAMVELKASERRLAEEEREWKRQQRSTLREDLDPETITLATALRKATARLEVEAEKAKGLRVELREVRAKQQHRLRQGSKNGQTSQVSQGASASSQSQDVKEKHLEILQKREEQLQLLRMSLTSTSLEERGSDLQREKTLQNGGDGVLCRPSETSKQSDCEALGSGASKQSSDPKGVRLKSLNTAIQNGAPVLGWYDDLEIAMWTRSLRAFTRAPSRGLGLRAFADEVKTGAAATTTTSLPKTARTSGLPMTTPGAPGAIRPKVVIIGTGWASFRVLADIDTKKNDVTVISPRNHLLFTPMLASSALGTVNQRSICQPVRPLTAKKNATYYESSVVGVEKEKKLVTCQTLGGQRYSLPYDKLVVGIGFQPNDFNIPGVKENALFMKETADATRFKDHVLEKLEEAAYCHALDNDLTLSEEEKWKIQELLTFIVVGGGPTGVELAGELTDFLYNEVANLYKNLKPYIRVHMFTYDLLNTFDQKLQDYALTHLRKKQNVQVHLGAFVQKVEPNVVHVKLGESAMSIRYGTLVWCAGIKPHPFVSDFGFAMNDKGSQILVDEFLKVKDESGIYAIGDCATIDNYWLPQTAQVANQQGQYLAKALSMDEAKIKPFEFHNKGTMAYLGGLTAIMANLPGVSKITGFVAFLGWRFTYWFLQLSMRNRFMLGTDWLRTFIFGRDLTRFGPRSKPT